MSIQLKSFVLAAAVLGAAACGVGTASAMPLAGLDSAVATGSDLAPMVQDARWVCGPFRCHWAPNVYYRPRFWGPRWYRRWH